MRFVRALATVFGPHIPMILTPCDFYLWISLKGKVYEMNLHTLEEINNIHCEISTVPGELLLKQEVVHPILGFSKLINFLNFSIIEG